MIVSSLASFKKKFGITDEYPVEYEKIKDEIHLHIPIKLKYNKNKDIIKKAEELAQDRKNKGWTREDFFADFMSVREEVLAKVSTYYGKK